MGFLAIARRNAKKLREPGKCQPLGHAPHAINVLLEYRLRCMCVLSPLAMISFLMVGLSAVGAWLSHSEECKRLRMTFKWAEEVYQACRFLQALKALCKDLILQKHFGRCLRFYCCYKTPQLEIAWGRKGLHFHITSHHSAPSKDVKASAWVGP